MPPVPTPPVPPVLPTSSNCVTTNQPAAGGPPTQSPSSMIRASDGKMRIDMPNTTLITNPAAGHAILLDHLKQQAQVVPLTAQPPQMPQFQPPKPGMPIPPAANIPQVAAQDLGKSFIEGHPVQGMRYIVQPPAPPQMPQAPAAPQMPGMPPVPKAPPVPPPAQLVSEVWTSTQFNMPVLTKITTPAGVQTTYCKPAAAAEPNPSAFQIPPGYKVLMPKKS